MPTTSDSAIYNPAAYGTVPVIPATSTNTSTSETTSTPNLPNYDALASAASLISQNQMAGQLNPQDLANAQTWAAQRGVATGTGFGSPNNMAAYQQFLGLSAQQLEQQGLTNYEGLLAGAPRTTDTTGTQTIDNNVLAAEYAAAPNPYAAAMANLAAQEAGLSGGAGAGAGTGVGGQSAYQAAQAAAAAHGMGTTAGGAGTAPSTWSAGTGPAGGAPAISAGTPASGQGTGQGAGGSMGEVGANGGILDANGNEWLPLGDGSYMNMDTGEVSYQAPGASGQQPTSSGYMYTGANTPWQEAGYPSEQAYNDALDASIFGTGDTGDTTGNLGGLFGDWYSGGQDSGVVGDPGNQYTVGLGGATYPINYSGGYDSYGGSYGSYGGG
jgi:hypothetical protein